MGKLVCSMARDAINSNPQYVGCDFAMIRGGHICGDRQYADDSFFSLEDLETVNTDHVSIGVVEIPGQTIIDGVKSTRGETSRLFIQYCSEVQETDEVTHIGGVAIDPTKMYRIATTPTTIRDVAVFDEFFKEHPHHEEFVPLDVELMSHFAREIWWKVLHTQKIASIDTDGDGEISKSEIHDAMSKLGYRVAAGEYALVNYMIDMADTDNDGKNSIQELMSLQKSIE